MDVQKTCQLQFAKSQSLHDTNFEIETVDDQSTAVSSIIVVAESASQTGVFECISHPS